MATAFDRFSAVAKELAPRTAVVLGSGLGGSLADFREQFGIPYGEIPGLVSPTVYGHAGRCAVGTWGESPVVIFFGRLHFYEGHSHEVVTGPVRLAAELGVKVLVLTNAAGGIHPALGPGSLMAIRDHIALIGPDAWRRLAAQERPPNPYSVRLVQAMQAHERAVGRELVAGRYAALTGPCYETPAEIRALRACGADAVGMSTALEAAAAAGLGLEVAAVSCVTNKAAGLSIGPLSHEEVLENAKLVEGRLSGLIGALVSDRLDVRNR